MLGQEKYDEVVVLIAEHLAQIMADEENGVYTQREEELVLKEQELLAKIETSKDELERAGKVMGITFVSGAGMIGFAFAVYLIVSNFIKKNKIKKLLTEHQKLVMFIGEDDKTLIQYLMDRKRTASEIESSFIMLLHDFYLERNLEKLRHKNLKNPVSLYESRFKTSNDLETFSSFNTKDLHTIMREVDAEVDRILDIRSQNYDNIEKFVVANKERVSNKNVSLYDLINAIKLHCSDGVLMSDKVIEYNFIQALNELTFRCEYEKFIKENANNIDDEHFDSSEFYSSLRKTDEYKNYKHNGCNDFSWMLPLLMMHMSNRRTEAQRREDARIAAELARKKQNSYSSSNSFGSFGGGFGGGHSSGGGFNGGW